MKTKIQIKSYSGNILFEYEKEDNTIKETIIEAVKTKTYLQGAYLPGAYLQGADLQGADLQGADLRGADLQGAYLQGADLRGAYLRGADLQGADLQGADLQGANLQGAYLHGAYLQGADLRGAKNLNKFITTPLYGMFDIDGKIHAYKLVDKNFVGIFNGGLTYTVGAEVSVNDANTDENEHCGAGINLATLDWCLGNYGESMKILICEFEKKDIAAIPIGSDGKFRVHRCKVLKEKPLSECGILEEAKK